MAVCRKERYIERYRRQRGNSTCDQVEGRDDSSEHSARPSPPCQGNQVPVQWALRKRRDHCALNKMWEEEKDMTGKLGNI